ncbi:hypothetical protein MA16_Dca006692 [Dendrobium catenatum]|uniref:Uncharacterized protein n=1 Tax=Dendrobium catenatum TaxID=906689 RepID=A0A2I0W8V6_9ASPA|nr:hypothetical protein MA16_Dca006692 [Dendrobium catenatum]
MYMNKKSHYAPNICRKIISKKALMYSDLMQSLLGKEAASIFCSKKSAPTSVNKI